METEKDNDVGLPRTRVYLARHGRTALNAAHALRGRLDPELDAVGWRQADWLGEALAVHQPRLVVASPLRRAVETAKSVAKRCQVEVEIDDRLIDRDYGQWAGRPVEAVEAEWGSVDLAPGVEPAATVRARGLDALADIVGRAEGGAAVVVSHDAVLRLTLAALDPFLGVPDSIRQETGCFNVLDCRAGHWTVAAVNQVPGGPSRPANERNAPSMIHTGERESGGRSR